MNIISSNKNKQNEIKNIIPKATFINIDLDEVLADNPIDIVVYKTLDAHKITKKDIVVEDVTMYVNDIFVPDIKWKQHKLKNNDKVKFVLTIGEYKNNTIYIYQTTIDGEIKYGITDEYDFGFDNIFIVDGMPFGTYKKQNNPRTLYKNIGTHKKLVKKINIEEIPQWVGGFQNKN